MKTFIRVTEIWVPSRDGRTIEFGGGLYGPLTEFRTVSENTQFALGEGLPGKAWASRHPIVLKEFRNSYFQRTDAAAAAGLTCGVALPVFAGDALKAVMVFLCGSDEAQVGAIEVWTNDPAASTEIELADGYYGSAELFDWTSRNLKFGRGYGLPGLVWQTGMPLIMNELYRPGQFLRWKEALQVGLSTGLGIPCLYDPKRTWVMTFLSALGTPIARRFETWVPANGGDTMRLGSATCDSNPRLAADYASVSIAKGEGIIGQALQSGVPATFEGSANQPSWMKQSLEAAGLEAAVALPVMERDGQSKAIVAWYF